MGGRGQTVGADQGAVQEVVLADGELFDLRLDAVPFVPEFGHDGNLLGAPGKPGG